MLLVNKFSCLYTIVEKKPEPMIGAQILYKYKKANLGLAFNKDFNLLINSIYLVVMIPSFFSWLINFFE